ncbi:HTH_Tnp_Tc3_2 domain-containing protein [Trichonephila clavipes]|uniref:HTH_Tnp_Tc3_2 domain-containing protein n=1 Tax=Trichonephila clavipes TaxID=2585209 RepID=A0A8X7BJV9_TRICX|nr:HTH_Tnp_Tc3_2 domain-containing protein [Trichonephila clavipes]
MLNFIWTNTSRKDVSRVVFRIHVFPKITFCEFLNYADPISHKCFKLSKWLFDPSQYNAGISLKLTTCGVPFQQPLALKLHWCAKIKDEVEKLAYQLNEEAERTERPIRRLSRIIGKLEEGRSVTSVAAEFGIAHSIVSRLWRQFQTTGIAIRGFSRGRPRGTTPADDRYIVLHARRNRRQTAGEIARHTTQATGRPISRFTVAIRLHGGCLFARRPVRCVPLTPAHRRRRSLWCREHWNWRDNEWGRVLFTDESRFSLSRDSHRILIL